MQTGNEFAVKVRRRSAAMGSKGRMAHAQEDVMSHSYDIQVVKICPPVRPTRDTKEKKKERRKEGKKQRHLRPTVANWVFARPPMSLDRNQILCGGSLRQIVVAGYKFHSSSK